MTTRRLRQALWARLVSARSEHDRGFTTLEAVVVIPVVVIVTMLVVQYVMLWHARNVTEAAAQDALRIARGYEAAAADGQAAGTEYLHNAAGKLLETFTVTVNRGSTTVSVHVHGTVSSVLPFGTYTVDEYASGPVEKYVTGT